MFTDPIRQVAAWLSDATLGVNALRANVPVAAPAEVPPAVTIVSAAELDWVARGVVDRTKVGGGPLLLVAAPQGGEFEVIPSGQEQPDTTVAEVVIRYASRGDSKKDLQNDAWQTMRVVSRSLILQAHSRNITTRNQVRIGPLKGLKLLTGFDDSTDDFLIDLLAVSLGVSDPWACGATAS